MNSNMSDNGNFHAKFFVAECTIVRFGSKLDPLEQKYKYLKLQSNFENLYILLSKFYSNDDLKYVSLNFLDHWMHKYRNYKEMVFHQYEFEDD